MKTAINMTMRAFIVKIAKNNNTIAEYVYDALGRRIRKIAGADIISCVSSAPRPSWRSCYI